MNFFKLAIILIIQWIRSDRSEGFSFVTLLSIVGFIVGIASLVVALSVIAGFEETLYENIARINGHIHIRKIFKNNREFTLFQNEIRNRYPDAIVNIYPLLSVEALVVAQGKSHGVLVQGLNIEEINPFLKSLLPPNVHFLKSDEIIIAQGISKKMGLKSLDTVTLVFPLNNDESTQTFHRKYQTFIIKEIVNLGKYEYNERMIFLNLQSLQQITESEEKLSGVVLQAKDRNWALEIKHDLENFLGSKYRIQTWYDINSYLFEAIKIERVVIFFIIFIIVIASSFNIGISLWIGVLRKTRQLNLLRVLGLSQKRILQLMILFGLTISNLGFFLGLPLGILLSYGVDQVQIFFNLLPEDVYKLGYLKTFIRLEDVLIIFIAQFLLAIFSVYWPAKSATQLNIAEGLRFE